MKKGYNRIISTVIVMAIVICSVFYVSVISNAEEEFPARLDLRERGVVTPVKFQNPWSSCWAFGGIAAAETSILSESGETNQHYKEKYGYDFDLSEKHLLWFGKRPITAKTNYKQAGEGLCTLNPEDEVEVIYNAGGENLYTTTLFSTGVGPVFEALFPYQGAEGLTAYQYAEKYPDKVMGRAIKAIENSILHESFDNAYNKLINPPYDLDTQVWVNKLEEDGLLAPYPDVRAITREQFQDICYKEYLIALQKDGSYNSYYASLDDWTIPEYNEDGNPNRDYYSGYTLLDGNFLPDMRIMENGKWVGINQKAINAAKSELMKGHGISVSYHADQSMPGQAAQGTYINTDTWAQYTYDDMKADHTVCIVGWDDNYPKENFNAGPQPPEDGAWIVKNSWGSETDWYDNGTGATINKNDWGVKDDSGENTGYFYLSYYDKSIVCAETMTFDNSFASGNGTYYVWAYDYMPAKLSHNGATRVTNNNVMKTANVFRNDGDEPLALSAVSTKTSHANASVEYSIYRVDENTTNFEEGTLLGKESATYEYEGFHRKNLDKRIKINPGETFVIVAEETIEEEGNKIYEININVSISKKTAEENNVPYYGAAVVNPGESFIYDEGKWIDWSGASSTYIRKTSLGQQEIAEKGPDIDSDFAVDNFSLKAYMVEASDDEVTPNLTEAQTVKVPKAPKTGDSIKQVYRYIIYPFNAMIPFTFKVEGIE